MVGSGQVDLVDRPVLLAPVRELDEGILLRYIRYGADYRIA